MRFLKLLVLTTLPFMAGCVSCIGKDRFNCHSRDIYSELQFGPHTDVKEPDLLPLLKEFIKNFKGLVPDELLDPARLYSYRYESIKSPENFRIIGLCHKWIFGEREILIAPEYYNKPYSKKAVFYHELGHCLLNLEHDEDDSIMNEFIFVSEDYLKDNWPKELAKFQQYVAKHYKM